MRTILEKALVHLLNEENDKADALFHKYMVTKAKQIHESLRQGDDALLESFDDINSDEMFTEDDLNGLEDNDFSGDAGVEMGAEGEAATDLGDAGADLSDAETETADAEADLSGEMGSEPAETDPEDRMDALMDKLEKLTAEFEAKLNGGDTDTETDGETDDADFGGEADAASGEETFGGDVDGEDADADGETTDDMQNDVTESEDKDGEDCESDDEKFEDLDESIISDLEKVLVSMQDGKEVGAGKSFEQNKKSTALQGKPDPMKDGKPWASKGGTHTGFERETAPGVKDMKKRKNTKGKSDEGQSKVSKEGDKSANINKDFAGTSTNDKSTLISR